MRIAKVLLIGLCCLAVAPASLVGGLIWYFAGARAMLLSASAVGAFGAALFYLRFAGAETEATTGSRPH